MANGVLKKAFTVYLNIAKDTISRGDAGEVEIDTVVGVTVLEHSIDHVRIRDGETVAIAERPCNAGNIAEVVGDILSDYLEN